MFSDNKTKSGAKRCSQKRGIIPAAPAFRPTPVIPRRKSVGKVRTFQLTEPFDALDQE